MVRNQSVRQLDLRQYNFYPTEWFVLLDDEVAVYGDYLFDTENIARAATSEDALVARNHGAGSTLVSNLSQKFDALFGACAHKFGEAELSGLLDWEMELRLGHWPHSSEIDSGD
jgi:hypothetical protein